MTLKVAKLENLEVFTENDQHHACAVLYCEHKSRKEKLENEHLCLVSRVETVTPKTFES